MKKQELEKIDAFMRSYESVNYSELPEQFTAKIENLEGIVRKSKYNGRDYPAVRVMLKLANDSDSKVTLEYSPYWWKKARASLKANKNTYQFVKTAPPFESRPQWIPE